MHRLLAALVVLIVAAVIGGITAGAVADQQHPNPAPRPTQPAGPAFPIPPGWHPLPTAPATGTATFCIGGTECFRVDGNGNPYGQPTFGGSANPGVEGLD